jgi:MFS family permease
VGRKPLIVVGMLLQGVGISLAASAEGLPAWIASGVLLGVGTGFVYPTLIAAVGDSSPPMRRASAIGIYRWLRDGGFVVGGLLAGLVAEAHGFHSAFIVIAGINFVSAFLVGAFMTESFRGHGLDSSIPDPS